MTTGRINQVSIVRTRGAGQRRCFKAPSPRHTRRARQQRVRPVVTPGRSRGWPRSQGGTARGVVLQRGTHRVASPFLAEKKHSDVLWGSVKTVQRAGRRPKCFTRQRVEPWARAGTRGYTLEASQAAQRDSAPAAWRRVRTSCGRGCTGWPPSVPGSGVSSRDPCCQGRTGHAGLGDYRAVPCRTLPSG